MVDMNDANVLLPTSFTLSAFEGAFEFSSTNGVDTLVASNLNLGDSPMVYSIDNIEAMTVAMDTLGFSVNGAEQTFALDTNLDVSFSIANINAAFALLFSADSTVNPTNTELQGSLTMSSPANTVFTNTGVPVSDPLAPAVTEITQGGPFTVTGSGFFLGSLIVNASECFTETASSNFPFESTACPVIAQ
jgi:hypothetical protein